MSAARRGRPPRHDRSRALGTAMLVFWERGYEAASIAELATAMGMNPPSIYHLFGSKDTLFEQAVDAYLDGVGGAPYRALLAAGTAREGVERMLTLAVDTLVDPATPRGCLVVLGAGKVAAAHEDIRKLLADRRAGILQTIRDRIADDARRDRLAPGTDVDGLASLCAAVLDGLSVRAVDTADEAQLRATVTTFMTQWPGHPGENRKR